MELYGCSDDSSLGPGVRGCRSDFDFTLKFEQIIFSILPSCIFIVLCTLRLYALLRRQSVVDGVWFQITKAGGFAVFAALRFAILAFLVHAESLGRILVAGASLDAIAALCMVPLSFFEHSRSPRPSILLNLYLIVKTLFDIARTRTFWLASTSKDDVVFSKLFTAATVLLAVVGVLEAMRKRRWVRWHLESHSPEETAGIYELATFTWIFGLLQSGRKKILTTPDLYKLDFRMSAEALHLHVEELNIPKFGGKKNALAKALFKTLIWHLMLPVLPLLCDVALSLCQPLLIQRLLAYLDSTEPRPDNVGYGLIGATIFIYCGSPLVYSVSKYYQTRYLFIIRSVLVDAVYRKTVMAQCSAADEAKALTLMGTDVEKIRNGFRGLQSLWSIPLQAAFSCWLLYRQLGAAFAAPLVLIVCLVAINAFAMRWVQPLQSSWMEKLERRVGKTSNVIANMKNIKISGLAQPIEHSIQTMRIDEVKAATKFRVLEIIVMVTGFAPGALSAMFTFAVTSEHLDVATIFTSVALLELLAGPLNILFQQIPDILSAFVCIQRVQTFLEAKSREDFRQKRSTAEQECETSTDSGRSTCTITISDGNFGWESERMTLKGINASFFFGLNIVVGPVASGKSTLCKVLLGETPFNSGSVDLFIDSRKTAFCDQVPALFNDTIKANIVGFSDVNEQRYRQAIHATMLGPDLETFPNGDETKIGSNGITLSGGQKQRVSIARAIYEDCELYIFDDILSGLDNHTAQHVFSHVFGSSGLLRERNATIILCTHAVHYLSQATHIIALSSDGKVVEEGSFEHLVRNERYVQSLGVEHGVADEKSSGGAIQEAQSDAQPAITSAKEKPSEESTAIARASGDFNVLLHYFKSIGVIWTIVFLFTGVLGGFGWSFPTAWLAIWSNDASAPPRHHSDSFYLGVFSFLSCFRLAATMADIGVGWMVVAKISGLSLHRDAIHTVIVAPLRFFVKTDVGIITNLFSQDLSLIDNELPESLIDTSAMIWIVVGSSAIAATASPYLLIAYPFLFTMAYFIQGFYLKTSRQVRLLDLEAKSPLYTHFIDTMKSLATFRAFDWANASIHKNDRLLDASTNPAYQLSIIQFWLIASLEFLMAVIAIVVVVLATQLNASAGFAGASMVSLISFSGYLCSLIINYTTMETSLGAVSRLRSFGKNTEKEDLPGEDFIPPVSWPEKGRIEIGSVSVSYDYSPTSPKITSEKEESDGVRALRDIEVTIESRQKVAICGRTGRQVDKRNTRLCKLTWSNIFLNGKSSFILMLLRLLDPVPCDNLRLAIDGLSLAEVNRGSLRERLIAVPQEPVFLPNGTSFRLNLDPGQVATEECTSALEAVELWGFVSERGGLHGGLSADVFSLGQKQLFSLARAILRRRVRLRQHATESERPASDVSVPSPSLDSKAAGHTTSVQINEDGGVLILDEYSSSLDLATDKLMQEIILKEFSRYTIVMVSHRLEMVMEFDKVIVLDAGRVVENGAPRELVEQDTSRFKDLWMARNSK